MKLPAERVGPYVRALHAGLNALAPHEDYVPLREALAHLRALDPDLSADVLFPAEVITDTGMPAFVWMERAVSERALAIRGGEVADELQIHRAESLDPDLGRRMRARRDLHAHLRRWALLPTTRVAAAVRCLRPATEITVAYDRMAPDGRWLRIRAIFRGPLGSRQLGPLQIDGRSRVHVGQGLIHLLTRHFSTPLLALQRQLADALGAEVPRLSRGWVGPFWFPGIHLPETVPADLGRGLLLNVSTEVVAEDVQEEAHLDPMLPRDEAEVPPEGQRIYRERRFAGTPNVQAAARRWGQSLGIRNVVVGVGGAPRKKRL